MIGETKIICLAVDDEPPALDILKNYISAISSLELAGTCNNAVEALNVLQTRNIDLLFLDIQMPQLLGTDLIRTLNSWMQTFCAQRNYSFLDYYSEMVDASGMIKADLANDGLHPNSAGYRIMAPLALAAINRTLTQTSPQQKPKRRRLFTKQPETGY